MSEGIIGELVNLVKIAQQEKHSELVDGEVMSFAQIWYSQLWQSINGPESWARNPWVWVVEFRRAE